MRQLGRMFIWEEWPTFVLGLDMTLAHLELKRQFLASHDYDDHTIPPAGSLRVGDDPSGSAHELQLFLLNED
jgi:hypothetical protein